MARSAATYPSLIGGVALLFWAAIAVGSVSIPLSDVLRILTGREAPETSRTIVREFRLPRAIGAATAGAGLAASGLLMQTLFRNPLAGPFVLGIDAGASLGVALVILAAGPETLQRMGLAGELGRTTAACGGASAVMLLSLLAARRLREPVTLLILGLMVGYTVGAAVSVLIHFGGSEQLRSYVAWTFGSFRGLTWDQLELLVPAVGIGLAVAVVLAKPLDALLLGEDYARTLGVSVERVRWMAVASASVLAGAVTAFCGPIAFLGVAVPHLARGMLKASDHRRLLPAVALLGAMLALASDLLTRLPGREESLPLSAVTSLLGAPIVVFVVLRTRGGRL